LSDNGVVTMVFESRGERTRAAILSAFVGLIFRNGFDHISVQSIAAEAGIARSTFYEHFSSKEDVLRASMAQFFVVLARCVSSDDQPPELANVLDHFWENRRLTDAIFAPTPRRILALSLSEMVEKRLRERSVELVLPPRLGAIHIAEAQLALVESWLRGRAFADPGDMAAALHRSSLASAAALVRAKSPSA
jgi:AcrR family transcriptional regulator